MSMINLFGLEFIRNAGMFWEPGILQAYLNIKSDGIFGPATESAVKLWQSTHKLDSDGVVCLETWTSMGLKIMDYEQIKNIINNDIF